MTQISVEPVAGPSSAVTHQRTWKLGYRADIEGLRAIAILLVVAAHAKLPFLQGGYVGVDVFFVLSGYLITGLLAKEAAATGGIGLAAFYARRLRRLLPALLLVVACTSLAAAVLLAPFEQANQIGAAKAATLWISNMFFAFARLDYFGPTADSNLYLHTWSLGVEEQFYLVWPAWVLFLLGAWRWQGRQRNFDRLRRGMLAVVALGFLFAFALTYLQPALAFYLMPSRAWQFALGGAVFLYSNRGGASSESGQRASSAWPLAGWLGLAMILGAGVLLDAHTPYPGAWALLPSLGAALLLADGPARSGAKALLTLAPMQWIGRVSYSWYLWHWPVLLLGATLVDMHSPLQVLALVAASLLLAAVSYRLVESPIRENRRFRNYPKASLVVGICMVGVVWLGIAQWQSLVGSWRTRPEQARFQDVTNDLPNIYSLGCDEWFHTPRVRVCAFGAQDARHTAVVLGDSVGLQWWPALSVAFDRPGWRVLVITKSSCPMAEAPLFYARIGREYTECTQWRASAIHYVQALHPDVLVLGSSSSYDLTETQWRTGTRRVLEKLHGTTPAIYVLLSTPMLPFEGPACLSRQQWRPALLAGKCSAPLAPDHHSQVNQWVAESARGFGDVHVENLDALACPANECRAQRNGLVVYRDNQHLTAAYVASLAPAISRRITPVDQSK